MVLTDNSLFFSFSSPFLLLIFKDKRHDILVHVCTRIAKASDLQNAWNGCQLRNAWRVWAIETRRANFAQKAYSWHLKSWLDKWYDRIVQKKRMRILLIELEKKMYTHYIHIGFWKWWRLTRRRFRIFHSSDGITRILQENERFTPRSSVVMSNWPDGLNRGDYRVEKRTVILDKVGGDLELSRLLPNGQWI